MGACGGCTAFCATLWRRLRGLRETLIRDPPIMLQRHLRQIAQPLGDHVERKDVGQFGFLAGAEILERLGPGGNPGPFEDPLELRPQVAVIPALSLERAASR